jgi:hypothetical protein
MNILYAFDPTNLASIFYDSKQALHARDKLGNMARYVTPTVSNGKVYVAGKDELTVFGLLPSLAVAGGNNQTGSKKEVLPIPLSVLASDPYTQTPFSGISVTCSDNRAGGEFIPSATQTTNGTGIAAFTYQLPGPSKVVTITCSAPTFSNTFFTEICAPGTPASMKIASGNWQTGTVNTALAIPLVVKVRDANNVVVPGVEVDFTDNGAGGSFSATSGVTDAKGEVSVQYTTGPNPGKVDITASSTGLESKNFEETVE